MIKIKNGASLIKKSTKYTINFKFTQYYAYKIYSNILDNFEAIKNIIESENYLKDNIELYDGLSDDDLKFDVAYTKISNVIFEEEGSGGIIDRDIEFTVVVSIYNFDSLNKVLNDNWGLTLNSEYDNDAIESNDVSLCFSNLITGFYVNESNESFEIEWTDEDGSCVLENKTIVS